MKQVANDPAFESLKDFELFLGADPDSGFVSVCMRHGDLVRPLQCDEIGIEDDMELAALFSRNFCIDSPEGPVAMPAADWLAELSVGANAPRGRPTN